METRKNLIGGYNSETGECFCTRCGHKMVIDDNFMLSDRKDDIASEEDAICTELHCTNCGLSMTIYDTPESEKVDYPYWSDSK